MCSFPNLKPVHCSMSGSNCCFLTCIRIPQEAGKLVWYSYLLKNFLQFILIHTLKGFSIVNEAEVDVFLEFSRFFYGPMDVGNLISCSSLFSKSSFYIWKLSVHLLLKASLEDFEHYFASNQQSALITKFLLFRRLTCYANYICTCCPLTLQEPHSASVIL